MNWQAYILEIVLGLKNRKDEPWHHPTRTDNTQRFNPSHDSSKTWLFISFLLKKPAHILTCKLNWQAYILEIVLVLKTRKDEPWHNRTPELSQLTAPRDSILPTILQISDCSLVFCWKTQHTFWHVNWTDKPIFWKSCWDWKPEKMSHYIRTDRTQRFNPSYDSSKTWLFISFLLKKTVKWGIMVCFGKCRSKKLKKIKKRVKWGKMVCFGSIWNYPLKAPSNVTVKTGKFL